MFEEDWSVEQPENTPAESASTVTSIFDELVLQIILHLIIVGMNRLSVLWIETVQGTGPTRLCPEGHLWISGGYVQSVCMTIFADRSPRGCL